MNRVRQSHYLSVVLLWGVLGANPAACDPNTLPKAFLGLEELADGWTSQYGGIKSMTVAYCNRLLDFRPPPDDPNAPVPVQHLWVERIQQDKRYHARHSTSADGFKNADRVIVQAFDGLYTTRYIASRKSGSVVAGLTRTAMEDTNHLQLHLLLDRTVRSTHPEGILACQLQLTAPTARMLPQLESVGGQWCHVVENAWSDGRIKIWFAHEKGFLPLKFEWIVGDGFRDQRLVQEFASVETETGTIWYPTEAQRVLYRDGVGTTTTHLSVTRFIPDVPVNDETFRIKWPPGTYVSDHVRGTAYIAGEEDEPDLKAGKGGSGGGQKAQRQVDHLAPMPDAAGAGAAGNTSGGHADGSPRIQATARAASWKNWGIMALIVGSLLAGGLILWGSRKAIRKGGL